MKFGKLQNKVGEFLIDERDLTSDGLIRRLKGSVAEYEGGSRDEGDIVAALIMTALAFAYAEGIDAKAVTNELIDQIIASHITNTENQAKRPIDEIKLEIEAAVKAIAEKHGVKIRSINQECVNTSPDQSPF